MIAAPLLYRLLGNPSDFRTGGREEEKGIRIPRLVNNRGGFLSLLLFLTKEMRSPVPALASA